MPVALTSRTMRSRYALGVRIYSRAHRRGEARDQKRRGVYFGAVPFGFTITGDRKLGRDAKQQAAIADVHRLRREGISYHRIALTIRSRGVRISHTTVKNIVDGKIKLI